MKKKKKKKKKKKWIGRKEGVKRDDYYLYKQRNLLILASLMLIKAYRFPTYLALQPTNHPTNQLTSGLHHNHPKEPGLFI
jgi:hypothetical protein